MGHTRGDVFWFYVNQIFDVDTHNQCFQPFKDPIRSLQVNLLCMLHAKWCHARDILELDRKQYSLCHSVSQL